MTTHEFELNGINYYVKGEYIQGDDATYDLPSYPDRFEIFDDWNDAIPISQCCDVQQKKDSDRCWSCGQNTEFYLPVEPLNDEQLEQEILNRFYS